MPKTNYILFFIVLYFSGHAHAASGEVYQQEPIEKVFIFDRYGSPYSGSSILMSTRTLLNELEDYLIPKEKRQSIVTRIISCLVNYYIGVQLSTVNHEIFGHGFRVRSLGGSVDSYKFSFGAGGATRFTIRYSKNEIDKIVLIGIGGIEANKVLAKEIILKHFKYRTLDVRTYFVFLDSFLDLLNYVGTTASSEKVRNSKGNDIMNYLKDINDKHQTQQRIELNDLENATSSLLFNPLWTLCVYIFKDNPSLTIPHVIWNDIAYMPLIRPGLTPFGIAYYLENYIGYENKTALVSLYGGSSPFYTHIYGGLGLKTDELWAYQDYCTLDIEASLWYQPKLQLTLLDIIEDKNYWGGLIGVGSKFMVNSYFALYTKLLYKTKGFVEGVVAQNGLILQVGCSLHYSD